MHKLNWLPRNHSRLRLLQEKSKKINWEVIFDPSLLALVNELCRITLLKIGFSGIKTAKNGVLKKTS